MRNALLKLQKPTWQIPSTPFPHHSHRTDTHSQYALWNTTSSAIIERHHLRYASVSKSLKTVLAPVRCSATYYNRVDIQTSMTLGVKGKNQDYGISVLTRGWAKNNKNKTITILFPFGETHRPTSVMTILLFHYSMFYNYITKIIKIFHSFWHRQILT